MENKIDKFIDKFEEAILRSLFFLFIVSISVSILLVYWMLN